MIIGIIPKKTASQSLSYASHETTPGLQIKGPKSLARGGWCLEFWKMQNVRAEHRARLFAEEGNPVRGPTRYRFDWQVFGLGVEAAPN